MQIEVNSVIVTIYARRGEILEGWQSGRMRRTRNPVYGYTVSWVQIPLLPPRIQLQRSALNDAKKDSPAGSSLRGRFLCLKTGYRQVPNSFLSNQANERALFQQLSVRAFSYNERTFRSLRLCSPHGFSGTPIRY